MGKFKNLEGQTFGYLTVLKRTNNVDGKVAWICKCVCGNNCIAKTKDLLQGRQTNCGCKRKKKGVEQLHYIDGTCIEMLKNDKVRSNNKSGVTGVSYNRKTKRWKAEITLQGKRHYLGKYINKSDAIKARKIAKEQYHIEFINQHKI